jgi:phenylacetate-CoA ligase
VATRVEPATGASDVLSEVERLDPEQQRALQAERLPAQLEHVRRGSPFFAERLGDEPVTGVDDLALLPLTSKQELRDAQAEEPPLGTVAGVPRDRLSRFHVTSGTTGTPLLVGFTPRDVEASTRAGSRAFWAAGARPGRTILHCVNYSFYVGGVADHLSVEATGAAVVPVGLGQSDRLLDLFPVLRPNAMFSITSYAHHLAEVARARGLEPAELGLRTIVTGGEAGGDMPDVRGRIEATWNARAADTYGLGEVWPTFAAHCELRDGLHVNAPDLLVSELIDPEGERRLEWEVGVTGELVYTHLDREASPLVRYRSGDLATVLALACECGRRTPRFRLLGRVDDMIVVRGVNLFPSALEQVLSEAVPTLRGFAVVVDDPIPRPPLPVFVEAEEEVDGAALALAVRERLQVRVEVRRLAVGTIERSEHKTKRVWRRYAGDDPGWARGAGEA